MEVTSLKASQCCEVGYVSPFRLIGLEWKLPDRKKLRVQMPLEHSWQVRPLIHALFKKESCLSERMSNGSLPRSGWRLFNCVIDLLEEKKLGLIGGTGQNSGKELIGKPVSDPLPSFGPCTD